jgi:SulP family sulfate permease
MRVVRGLALTACLHDYRSSWLVADLVAGLSVGLLSLPLALAFAIASGVAPVHGLTSAIVAGFVASLLGGTRFQISGPSVSFVILNLAVLSRFGLTGVITCTLMAGLILCLMGLVRLGSTIKYLPLPVIVGFTNGIAVLIASTQLRDLLGLRLESVPGDFLGRLLVVGQHLATFSPSAALLGLGCLAVILVLQRYAPRVPGTILALAAASGIVAFLGLPVETIGTRFGELPRGLVPPSLPVCDTRMLGELLSPALSLALLGAIESLMAAVLTDRLSGDRHDPNQELLAQGMANIAAACFGGIASTGALARTTANFRAGAVSPIAGMIAALTIWLVLVFAAPLARAIPLAGLSAALLVVAYNMGAWQQIPKICRMSWATVVVWLATFLLTLFAELTLAVQLGIVLAALLYIRKVTQTTTVSILRRDDIEGERVHLLQDKDIPQEVLILNIYGPFLFGASEKLQNATRAIDTFPPLVILRLRNMTAIDATGLLAIEDLAQRLRQSGRVLLLSDARPQPAELLQQSGFAAALGPENNCPHLDAALERARELLAQRGTEGDRLPAPPAARTSLQG